MIQIHSEDRKTLEKLLCDNTGCCPVLASEFIRLVERCAEGKRIHSCTPNPKNTSTKVSLIGAAPYYIPNDTAP